MGSLHVGLEVRLRQPGELSPAVSHSALKVSTRIFLGGTANKYLPKESASQFNKSILKDNPYIHKLSGTYLFPRSRYQYIYQLTKAMPRAVSATTHGSQPLVVISNTCGN